MVFTTLLQAKPVFSSVLEEPDLENILLESSGGDSPLTAFNVNLGMMIGLAEMLQLM